jgi:catechol 2,3-dioxygenase-like lactoylglutathione lyase family enzyme
LDRVIDHVTLRVSDFEASKAFYSTVLAPLGIELGWENAELKLAEWGDFSIAVDGKPLTQSVHVAFAAKSRAEVDAFHRAALAAGYRDNGPPGERPIYHEGYYGAYVLDPDGNNVEAVFHDR